MILAYRQRQVALRHQPTKVIIDITSPPEDHHVISPEPEALPSPPWFLHDVAEDLPRNPRNKTCSYGNPPPNHHGYPSVLQHMVYVE
jgi:hypothetical protein